MLVKHLSCNYAVKHIYNNNNFYISGVGHCYPGKSVNGGDKMPPKMCADKWLRQEIKFVKSKIIVLIGRYSANYFFPEEDFSKLIFNNQEINNCAPSSFSS